MTPTDRTPTDLLTDSDSLMWRIEADPVLRSPIVVVGMLDREPKRAALHAALDRAVLAIPRLRQRVVSDGGRLAWADDPAYSLTHHLRFATVDDGGGVGAVLAVAEPDAAAAFDPVRPLWQLTVVTGLDGGQAAFILRFHHTITDGVGGVALAEGLFDRRRTPARQPAASAPVTTVPRSSPDPDGPGVWASFTGLAAGAVRVAAKTATDPRGSLLAGWRVARSVERMVAPTGPPLSPLLVGRGIDRRLHVLELPFAGLLAAGHAADGTVNDAFLAAVGGAMREYHETLGTRLDSMRVTMPISLRTAEDAPGGNRFTPARFEMPIDDPDPAGRIRLASAIVRRIRAEPAVGLTSILASVLNRLPGPLVTSAFGAMLRSIDVDAVDVPGLRRAAYFAGAKLDRMWAFAPPTGAAMSITLVSHGDTAAIGVATDVAAVAEPELLVACLGRALDDVLTLAPAGYQCRILV